jgi:hypothetical protein
MKKKILIGSIFVLILLLVMPSIPAIQMKTIEDRTYNDLVDQLDVKDVKEIKGLEQIKHPFLYNLVKVFLDCRLTRMFILQEISCDINPDVWWVDIDVYHPVLFLRCIMLLVTTAFLGYFWNNLSNTFEWDWDPFYE